MEEYESVARTPEVGPGQVREVEAHGETLALLNVGQTYYAVDARCPADGTNLAREGRLKGELLVCPEDEAAYDVRTGERVGSDGAQGLQSYAIRVEGNVIRVGPALERE
ncbi:MAG TPA: Rieske 2Fe-2S domain-containing protein [Longimicrobiales bacterium]|nr:Rieske 2Fe-2S domain-containing protein [Longimicrobiales bacterium]